MVHSMNRFLWASFLVVAVVSVSEPARAAELSLPDKRETFGAVVAPAALPTASSAAYGYVGAPELGIGYRQGFGALELETRVRVNYMLLTGALEGLAKYSLIHEARLGVAPFLGVGFVANSGARYLDANNFAYLGLRALGGVTVSYLLMDTVRAVGQLEVPLDFPLARQGGSKFTPLAGGGAEIYLGQDFTGLLMGQLGVDVLKEPGGIPLTRLGYAVQLGFGYRLF